MPSASEEVTTYLQYVRLTCPHLSLETQAHVQAIAVQTAWEEPLSSLDLNNIAVLAFVQAESAVDLVERRIYFEYAVEALNKAAESDTHPLCAAHFAIANSLLGEYDDAFSVAFLHLLNALHPAYEESITFPAGLVYLPPTPCGREQLQTILAASNGMQQALMLMGEALWRSAPFPHNTYGMRYTQLAWQLLPHSAQIALRLGVYHLHRRESEGLLYLHRARLLAPEQSHVLHALYLAYVSLKDWQTADYWLQTARQIANQSAEQLQSATWAWTQLPCDRSHTYLAFDRKLAITVEPSYQSIVTSVLLAEGDWFEAEMEFWRSRIQPGMTVIDVGANVGVYTLSAALRVGREGLVLAVEPFSKCVNWLQTTCQHAQIDWVKVYAGAASDREGTLKLGLSSASECNEIIDSEITDFNADGRQLVRQYELVRCFTLDSLVDAASLQRVDFLKIDAEGQEMSVLQGSDRILREFAPIVLYENDAGSKGFNLAVGKFLQTRGYQLFRYQPYLQELIPLPSDTEFLNIANVIAVPARNLL